MTILLAAAGGLVVGLLIGGVLTWSHCVRRAERLYQSDSGKWFFDARADYKPSGSWP